MILRQLLDESSRTYTYLIADKQTRTAIIIDSVKEQVQRDLNLLKELGLDLKIILDTHVHADHISGAYDLQYATQATILSPCGIHLENATRALADKEVISLNTIKLIALATPGHTANDTCYYLQDHCVFTGDTLFVRGCGRTDLPGGNAKQLYQSITTHLFTLPESTLVYPAHECNGVSCSTIAEEKQYNPRLSHKSCDEFVAIMNQLNLPSPQKINMAIPANLKCGQTE